MQSAASPLVLLIPSQQRLPPKHRRTLTLPAQNQWTSRQLRLVALRQRECTLAHSALKPCDVISSSTQFIRKNTRYMQNQHQAQLHVHRTSHDLRHILSQSRNQRPRTSHLIQLLITRQQPHITRHQLHSQVVNSKKNSSLSVSLPSKTRTVTRTTKHPRKASLLVRHASRVSSLVVSPSSSSAVT